MSAAESVARMFIARHRRRRELGTSGGLLSMWCAWEDVRDVYACSVADDAVHGRTYSMQLDLERYKLAVERMDRARDRYLAHANERAKLRALA